MAPSADRVVVAPATRIVELVYRLIRLDDRLSGKDVQPLSPA